VIFSATIRIARKNLFTSQGVRAGVADLCLPAARRGHHGLYLEMKSEEGVATKEQKVFLRGVMEEGYCAVIAEGVDEAREALEWYIGISDQEPASALKAAQICQARSEMSDSFAKVRAPSNRGATLKARKRSVGK
jgi:hypothetical protein